MQSCGYCIYVISHCYNQGLASLHYQFLVLVFSVLLQTEVFILYSKLCSCWLNTLAMWNFPFVTLVFSLCYLGFAKDHISLQALLGNHCVAMNGMHTSHFGVHFVFVLQKSVQAKTEHVSVSVMVGNCCTKSDNSIMNNKYRQHKNAQQISQHSCKDFCITSHRVCKKND